jgi:hypothetical protein
LLFTGEGNEFRQVGKQEIYGSLLALYKTYASFFFFQNGAGKSHLWTFIGIANREFYSQG